LLKLASVASADAVKDFSQLLAVCFSEVHLGSFPLACSADDPMWPNRPLLIGGSRFQGIDITRGRGNDRSTPKVQVRTDELEPDLSGVQDWRPTFFAHRKFSFRSR
jgi:hypothetical protein